MTTTSATTIDENYIAKSGFIMAKPKVVEVTVEKRKIEGRATIKNSQYGATAVASARKLAVIDAVKKNGVDIIVQPVFTVISNSTNTTATVTGFAGTYKAFRDITPADRLAFKVRSAMDFYSSYLAVPGEKAVTTTKK